MPLDILLMLVVGGIAGIAILLHATGRSARKQFTVETAAKAWSRHFPDDPAGDILLSRSGQAAIVTSASGSGLIWAFGADDVARYLRQFDLRPWQKGLHITFHEYAAPGVWLTLSEDEKRLWTERFEEI